MSDCRAFACASRGCQATIHLHHDIEERLRRTHETFYCPAGHSNYFAGKTDNDKKIERLERQVERWRESWNETYHEREEWRLRAKSCPFECGFRSRRRIPESITADLILHLVEEHGATMPEPVVEEAVKA